MTTGRPKDKAADKTSTTRWDLIRRLRNRDDSQAWQEFDRIYGIRMLARARQDGLSPEEAQDVVQETLFEVAERMNPPIAAPGECPLKKAMKPFIADPAAGSFKSWLFQLLDWRVKNQFKKRSWLERAGLIKHGEPTDGEPGKTSTTDRIADPMAGTGGGIGLEDWRAKVVELALEKLKKEVKDRHFQVFYLLVIKGQKPAQVCKALGVNRGQVYLVKHRLLPLFRKMVAQVEAELL
jgi:DNA-directed RNA polymerase specialized sigma24 family protein